MLSEMNQPSNTGMASVASQDFLDYHLLNNKLNIEKRLEFTIL